MLFDNTKRAFHLKTDYDLKKALIIFKLISSKRLVKIGSCLVYFLNRINMSIHFLFRETIFKQFCAGTNKQETLEIVDQLSKSKIYSFFKKPSFLLSHELKIIISAFNFTGKINKEIIIIKLSRLFFFIFIYIK